MEPGWQVEYAKSNRATCGQCGRGIDKDELRIGIESRSSFHDGFQVAWAHVRCVHSSMPLDRIKDLDMLRWDDQARIRDLVHAAPLPAASKKAVDALWAQKDVVADNFKPADMETLLRANGYQVDEKKRNVVSLVHKVADGLLNGLAGPCPSCHSVASLRWTGIEFICRGWQTEYVRCDWRGPGTVAPNLVQRFVFQIPKALKDSHKFLKKWSPPAGYPTAVFSGKAAQGSASSVGGASSAGGGGSVPTGAADEEVSGDDDSEVLKLPEDAVPVGQELYGMRVLFVGTKAQLGATVASLGELVENHGGEKCTDVADATVAVASAAQLDAKKKVKKIEELIAANVPIVSVDWLHTLTARKGAALKLRGGTADAAAVLKSFLLSDAALLTRPLYAERYDKARIARRDERDAKAEEAEAARAKKRKRREPVAGSEILRVDPGTGKDKTGKIYVTYDDEYGYTPYNCALNLTDLQTGVNKYYKMQIVQMPAGKTFWFWISYGRVGVDSIGDQRVYEHSESGAIEAFEEKFLKFTGQPWSERDRFAKKPGKYYMIELDDGHEDVDDDEVERARQKRGRPADAAEGGAGGAAAASTTSGDTAVAACAHPAVRGLVQLIFDKTMMAKQLKSMDVDLKKMPLGKISKRQILQGYRVLSDIEAALGAASVSRGTLADLTTRFYTLVPHDFGETAPPLIESSETVAKKQKLLEALMDISIATDMSETADAAADPVVAQYRGLNCGLTPLDAKSKTFKLISSYMSNQAGRFKVKLDTAFQVARAGEDAQFETQKSLGNLALLWHGSGLANYVGILSQGLRIAPPEAPVSGYRLGKGVYLADLFEKSASYCRSGYGDDCILIMLIEAALGKQFETLKDHYMEKPQPGTHSTLAKGSTVPQAAHDDAIDGTRVPLGPPHASGTKNSAFMHNEYVVYDKSQVRIRYLLKVRIN
jgi:hypothetical protein